MKHEIPLRIKVLRPLAGVALMVQRGRDELLPPSVLTGEAAVFDFGITVDLSSGKPNFLGKYAQGPKDARFVYVNSGTYGGQHHSLWGRRAKISLSTITPEQINAILAGYGQVLQTEFNGVGSDGGPTCASVKGLEWKVAKA